MKSLRKTSLFIMPDGSSFIPITNKSNQNKTPQIQTTASTITTQSSYLAMEKLITDFNSKINTFLSRPKFYDSIRESKINRYTPLLYLKHKPRNENKKSDLNKHCVTEPPYKTYLTLMRSELKKNKMPHIINNEKSESSNTHIVSFDFSKQLPRKPLFTKNNVKYKRFMNTFSDFEDKKHKKKLYIDIEEDQKRMEILFAKSKSHICEKIQIENDQRYKGMIKKDEKLKEEIRKNFKVY